MISGTSRELERTPDLADLVGGARDSGHDAILIERPMPDAVSIAAIGRSLDLVATDEGVAAEDPGGAVLDFEPGENRILAAARLWERICRSAVIEGDPGFAATGLVAAGGFAFRPERQPADPWAGFPGLLLRVPELAVVRVRGRTFACSFRPGAEDLLDSPKGGFHAPAARSLEMTPVRSPVTWKAAVARAAERLRAGEAEKVVLAREVMAHGDGVISAGAVARALRAAYPSCFTYLITGADGTTFTGASPELLLRRSGRLALSQPMAGSIARGMDEEEDSRLAADLESSAKDASEHALVARHVAAALAPFCERVDPGRAEVVRFTNIQHLATTVSGRLRDPAATALEIVAALHPTPAVGGWPVAPALAMIDDLEAMERGWYAGAAGWVDGRGDGEFAVALRCGLLWGDGARLYAGVGVMPGSDPARELDETALKLRALMGALTV